MFAYLGFEQADQLAGEIKNPRRNLPLAIIIATVLGITIYTLLQVVFIGATPPSLLTHGFAGIPAASQVSIAPFAGVAGVVGLGAWAVILRIDAFVSPFGTGLIYQTSSSRVGYGLARNRYFPQIFQWTDSRGVPWVSLLFAFVFGLVFLLPFPSWHSLVSLVTLASVLMYAGAPLSLGAFRGQVPEADRPYQIPCGSRCWPRSRSSWPTSSSTGPASRRVEAGHLHRHRLRADRRLHGLRQAAAADRLEDGDVAAGLPDRHGHHLLAGPVQRRRRSRAGQHQPTSRSGGTCWSWPGSA